MGIYACISIPRLPWKEQYSISSQKNRINEKWESTSVLILEKNEITWEDLPFCSEGKEGLVKSLEKRTRIQ